MDCQEFARLFDARRARRLTPYAAALLDWHRSRCPRCAMLATAAAPGPSPAPRVYWGRPQSKGTYV